jgi:hypothetical protein
MFLVINEPNGPQWFLDLQEGMIQILSKIKMNNYDFFW